MAQNLRVEGGCLRGVDGHADMMPERSQSVFTNVRICRDGRDHN